MNGHWESSTRKLNRHYQSGGSDTFTLSGLYYGIAGFEWGAPYEQYDGNWHFFYDEHVDKVIAAPFYKLFPKNSLPTSHTVEQAHFLYGSWRAQLVSGQGIIGTNNPSSVSSETVNVWRFGDIKPEPYWSYDTSGRMCWAAPTFDDSNVNQNNISRITSNTYLQNGARSFETIYGAYEASILQPTYELVALPLRNHSISGVNMIETAQTSPSSTFENKIKVKGLKKSGIQRCAGSGDSGVHYARIIDDNVNYYLDNTADKTWSFIGAGPPEVGAFGWGIGLNFVGDAVFNPMYYGYSPYGGIVAGTDSGETMYYCMRLKMFESVKVQMSNYVTSLVY
jgi:hypothetical protein